MLRQKFAKTHYKTLRQKRFLTLKNRHLKKRLLLLTMILVLSVVPFHLTNAGIFEVPINVLRAVEVFLMILVAMISVSVIQGLTVSRVFNFLEGESEIEERIFFTKLYSFFLYAIAAAIVLWKLGLSASNITIFLGLATTGIAFAIRDIVSSFFAWFIILAKKPFRIGDTLQIGDETGVITRIGTFFLTLQTTRKSKDFWKIPNRTILDKPILNMGRGNVIHKKKITISKIPANIDQRLEKLKLVAGKYVENKDSVKTLINTDGDKWFIEFAFNLKPQEEAKRSKILKESYAIIKDIVKK